MKARDQHLTRLDRWRSAVAVGLLLVVALWSGCREAPPPAAPPSPVSTQPAAVAPAPIRFTDVTAAVGLDFVRDGGLDDSFFMPQIMAGGVALFDADGDGALDIYLLDGGVRPRAGAPSRPNRLFLQQADGTFRDATAESGLGDTGYGMSAAVGDIDNDGDLDVFVANYGADALYRNDGDGRFVDITAASGIVGDGWSTTAAFLDYDADGWLDLYVVRYLEYDPGHPCLGGLGEEIFCAPDAFPAAADDLFHNDSGDSDSGDSDNPRRFRRVTESAGLGRLRGPGLGVVAADLTGDGRIDIYVANDGGPNFLLVNRGDGSFVDEGIARGVGVNDYGAVEAGMGIAIGDTDGDGDLDLVVTHLTNETHTLYLAEPSFFRDGTDAAGLGEPSLAYTGFGVVLADFDLDFDLDLAAVNGTVGMGGDGGLRTRARPGVGVLADRYGQPAQLFENAAGRFRDVTDTAGDFGATRFVGRGLAAGDLDGDGDLDLVASAAAGPVRVYRNDTAARGHHLGVRMVDPRYRRDALGAQVELVAGDSRQLLPVGAGGSYLSSSELTVRAGVGSHSTVAVAVRWPDGLREDFGTIATDQTVLLERGSGRATPIAHSARSPALAADPTPAATDPAAASDPPAASDPSAATDPAELALRGPLDDAEPQVALLLDGARQAVTAAPDSATAWGRLGVLMHAHLRFEQARYCYQRSLDLTPDDPTVTYLLAAIETSFQPERALDLLERVEQLSPQYIPALVRRGHILRMLNRHDEAIVQYQRALALDPGCAAALLGLGQVALALGRPEVALQQLDRAARAAPRSAPIRRELARALARLGRTTEAQAEAATADQLPETDDPLKDPLLVQVQMEAVSIGAVMRRAGRHRMLGDLQAALFEMTRAVELAPDRAVVFNNRGLVRLELDDKAGALADFDRALALDPTMTLAMLNRAEALARTGRKPEAIAQLKALLALEPGQAHARKRLDELTTDP